MAAAPTGTLDSDRETMISGCGLLDRSERGKLALRGADAVEFLNGQITNELADLQPGEGRYAAFLTHKGKMLGDLRVLLPAAAADEPELLLDTERSALQALFDMIRRFKLGYRVELDKRTLESALLSLIGPRAQEVAGAEGLGEAEHDNLAVSPGGIAALAIRTDLGVDLLCAAADAGPLRAELERAGAVAVEEAAVECLRIEAGRPRYGVELDETVIPQEAGLNERAVSFTKGCYVGQETVARLYYRGRPNRHLRGLMLSGEASPGDQLALGERAVGTLGSLTRSPLHGPIGLALVRREAEPGTVLSVGAAGVEGTVVELPFGAARDSAR